LGESLILLELALSLDSTPLSSAQPAEFFGKKCVAGCTAYGVLGFGFAVLRFQDLRDTKR
jgi:hypothetical protein